MSDQCKHCVKRGKYEECIKNECGQMETWIIQHLLLLIDIEHRRRVAADKYIMVKARNEMIVDTGRQLTDEEHDQQYQAFTEYTSILQERKSATGENIEEVVK